MTTYDWTRFTKRIDIKATPDQLVKSWTTRNGIESWFLRAAEFYKADGSLLGDNEPISAGNTYKWKWHGFGDDVMEKGKILSANAAIQFTFGGNPESPIVVTVTFPVEEGVQLVELTQENIPEDEQSKLNYHFGCMEGWTFYLINLKSILEGGIDLRNRNVNLQRVINK